MNNLEIEIESQKTNNYEINKNQDHKENNELMKNIDMQQEDKKCMNVLSKYFGQPIINGRPKSPRYIEVDELQMQLQNQLKINHSNEIQGDILSIQSEYKKQMLAKQLRQQAIIFLLLNLGWTIFLVIFTDKVTNLVSKDNYTLSNLKSAQGLSIFEILVWFFSNILAVKSLICFQIKLLTIYQIGIMLSLTCEIMLNIMVIPLIPIYIPKFLVIVILQPVFFGYAALIKFNMQKYQQQWFEKKQSSLNNDMKDDDNMIPNELPNQNMGN